MKVKCETCDNKFDKYNYQIKKDKHHFCSRRCSNISRNKDRWKNHIKPSSGIFLCSKCGKKRDWRGKSKLCNDCNRNIIIEKGKSTTIGEIKQKYKLSSSYWYSSPIRGFAKNWNKNLIFEPCQKCGYNMHTELCHIKPIGEMPDHITLGEINSPSNLIVLCPNHHWEFDNGILKLEDIPSRNGEAGGS